MFWGYECSRLDWDHHQEPARVCGKEGPSISLACVLWYFVVCIFWSVFYKRYKIGEEDTDNGNQKAQKASEVQQEDPEEVEMQGEHKHRHRHHHRNGET
eukprot:CAMPEP_0202941274 /NCGR_PEP_ID=MMETSP1395-20130829/1394_1 /ASSEMBLY_ACC=CAM_ASM_000871 /TAXON_ID=5961 /ORGANISM="Blepharisma japonicum, Strain Stock R1072" /LENGTH=98 /DNA_ID=CAMNT_0049636347 /DNA_START=478 /DNA_END=770 /DNA_ORIENTATION=-